VDPRATLLLEGLSKFKTPMISSGIETITEAGKSLHINKLEV
jgi:hypothetical protein